jgi:hypothetical protein
VTGLTTAWLLSQRYPSSEITIVAKDMPGDYDLYYASPWAGANYQPFAAPGTQVADWERNTYDYLYNLATNVPGAGIHLQRVVAYWRDKDGETPTGAWLKHLMSPDPWFKDLVKDVSFSQKRSSVYHV